jgi:hypothetical protein
MSATRARSRRWRARMVTFGAFHAASRSSARATMHLTYPNSDSKSGGVEPEGSDGAPEHESEVTPEMIKAGAEILKDYFYEEIFERAVDLSKVCTDLFHAMSERRTEI